jgi:hypothetical protein
MGNIERADFPLHILFDKAIPGGYSAQHHTMNNRPGSPVLPYFPPGKKPDTM